MFIDTQGMSDADKTKKRRQLLMEQMQYQSDLKKTERKQNDLKDEMRRLEQERNRTEVYINENKEETQQNIVKADFYTEELRRIKKQIIELG